MTIASSRLLAAACLIIALAGCASTPPPAPTGEPGHIPVVYTRSNGAGGVLREPAEFIEIVRREHAQNEVGRRVGLNVLMLAMGGLSLNTFDRNDLRGERLPVIDSADRIVNPIHSAYAGHLERWINDWIREDEHYAQGHFTTAIHVGQGATRLVYTGSSFGQAAETFELRTDLTVFRSLPARSMFLNPPMVRVNCSEVSEQQMTEAQWAENDYEPLHLALAQTLERCDALVAEALPQLLAE